MDHMALANRLALKLAGVMRQMAVSLVYFEYFLI